MKNTLYLFLIAIVTLSSCKELEEPTIEKIEDVDIVELTKDKIELDAYMILNNPNGFALDLSKAELKTYVDNIELASINQVYDTSMPANSTFRMPIHINLDLKRLYKGNPLGALGKGLQIISDKQLDVHFKGTIKVGKGVVKVSVPVDQKEVVKF